MNKSFLTPQLKEYLKEQVASEVTKYLSGLKKTYQPIYGLAKGTKPISEKAVKEASTWLNVLWKRKLS